MADALANAVDRPIHVFLQTLFGALSSNSMWSEQFESPGQTQLSGETDKLRK